jgi:hypothetical protein
MPVQITAKDVFNRARVHLNDAQAQVYTDIVLKEYLQTALDELAEVYEDNGLPLTDKVTPVALQLAAGVRDIGGPIGPALPNDLVEITALYERTSGSNQDFNLMRRMDFLPEYTVQTAYNVYWVWQQQFIRLLGATTALEVMIEYVANLFPTIVDANTVIPIINVKNTLAFRVAGLAAEFIGENASRGQSLNGQAGNALDRLMNLSVRGEQFVTTRRRPFRANYKQRSRGW